MLSSRAPLPPSHLSVAFNCGTSVLTSPKPPTRSNIRLAPHYHLRAFPALSHWFPAGNVKRLWYHQYADSACAEYFDCGFLIVKQRQRSNPPAIAGLFKITGLLMAVTQLGPFSVASQHGNRRSRNTRAAFMSSGFRRLSAVADTRRPHSCPTI